MWKRTKTQEQLEKLNLEWYVLCYDTNLKKVDRYNIFRNVNVLYGVSKAIKEYTTYSEFVKEVDSWLKYSFWSKAEYEIVVGDLFVYVPEKLEKIDIYYQLAKNVDLICKYILIEYNKTKRKKLEF